MWNFKGYLWNSTQNILPTQRKIWDYTEYKFKRLYAFKMTSCWFISVCNGRAWKNGCWGDHLNWGASPAVGGNWKREEGHGGETTAGKSEKMNHPWIWSLFFNHDYQHPHRYLIPAITAVIAMACTKRLTFFKMTFWSAFSWIEMSEFRWNMFHVILLTISRHWLSLQNNCRTEDQNHIK